MTTIEPLASADFETVARWLARPDINRWLTAEWRDKPVTATALAIAVRNRRNRLFLVRHDGAPCGLVALGELEPGDGTAMVWYALGERDLAGRGVTTAAVRALAVLAFSTFALRSLYAWAMLENTASIHVLRKAGFHEAGRIRQSASLDGRPTDRLYFDLTASDPIGALSRAEVREGAAPLAARQPAAAERVADVVP